jgi:hypothetical protein
VNEEGETTPVLDFDAEIFQCFEKSCHWTLAGGRVAVKIGISMSECGNGWQKPHDGSGKTNINNRWRFPSGTHKMWGNPQVKVSGWIWLKFIYLNAKISESVDHQRCVPGIKYAMKTRR